MSLLFAVCFIDVYSGCCKDNSKIKTINCEENKKSSRLKRLLFLL